MSPAARRSELKFDTLPGIADDPLAAMRKAAGKDALKGNRAVQVETSGDNGARRPCCGATTAAMPR